MLSGSIPQTTMKSESRQRVCEKTHHMSEFECVRTLKTLYVRGAAGAERPWEAEQDSVQTAVRISTPGCQSCC